MSYEVNVIIARERGRTAVLTCLRRAQESQAESNERRQKIRELESQIDLLKAQPAPYS
ncbi:hypothetical protein GEOBC_01557 [Geobacteraceae bacterium]|nr:hypothetical protein GEOBC_01557 [Geobacteraceae bacterium]